MNVTEFVRLLDADVRYRVRFETDRGDVVGFTVQLECVAGDDWRPVIRYDTAHGFAHCDSYGPDGVVNRHEPMNVSSFGGGLTVAVRKVRADWEQLVAAFRKAYP